ncbi:Hypothetical predicted protein [Xyrichtys novacula]|uniref:Uncharacterized protein n=1 Tax=Xyrichtys novacula TaxID=13765 RepID=A0AAV1FF93_XYRNO|nr:Hypothetical predicted protein [Xyrichtys novacula]
MNTTGAPGPSQMKIQFPKELVEFTGKEGKREREEEEEGEEEEEKRGEENKDQKPSCEDEMWEERFES